MQNYYGVLIGSTCFDSSVASGVGPINIGIAGHGNVLSGNTSIALIAGVSSVVASDNIVGLGVDGTTAIPNGDGLTSAGPAPGSVFADNVIASNTGYGVYDTSPASHVINNRIGVRSDGVSAPNAKDGVVFFSAGGVLSGNQIRNNGLTGVHILFASNADISGNDISANSGAGIVIDDGTGAIVNNDVKGNGGSGLLISGTATNFALHGNRISGNSGLGIDLAPAGVTPNDAGDGDTGPNGVQNSPQISAVTNSNALTTVSGSLSTKPGATATIEVFQSSGCDPTGFGEGGTPRGSVTKTVPASGTVAWQLQMPTNLVAGTTWTATATKSEGTSEFSACKTDTNAQSPAPTFAGWQPIGGGLKGAPAIASPGAGAFKVLIRGLDDAVWQTNQAPGSSAWGPWASLGGLTSSSPAAAGEGNGITDLVVRGLDDALWYRTVNGTSDTWQSLGGLTHDAPALVRAPNGVLHLFVRGLDDALWHSQRPTSGAWSGWESLGGGMTAAPAAVAVPTGELDIVVQGLDGAAWNLTRLSGGSWLGWERLGGGLRDAPAIAAFPDGSLHLFLRGLDDQLWHRARPRSNWSAFEPTGGILTSGPGVAADVDPNASAMTIGARGGDGQVWVRRYEVLPPA
jgi:parallel beta-helix repeat protein